MTPNTTKVCCDCKKTLSITEFAPDTAGRYRPRCRPCHRESRRRYKEGERTLPPRRGEIPSGPFLTWIAGLKASRTPEEVANLLQTNERFIWRWTNRPSAYIQETTVDAAFCAAGEPYLLRELYSELYEDLDGREAA